MTRMPANLSGMSVLDIGAWDGAYSFEAERRGAKRVVALDSFCWSGGGWGSKEGFELARKMLGSKVEDVEMEVLDVSPERLGTFDFTLFLGVLYHMKHPLLALEKVASVTDGFLILQTETSMLPWRKPYVRFFPGREMNNDPTNWCAPNLPWIRAALGLQGFKKIKRVYPATLREIIWEIGAGLKRTIFKGQPLTLRTVFHARKREALSKSGGGSQ